MAHKQAYKILFFRVEKTESQTGRQSSQMDPPGWNSDHDQKRKTQIKGDPKPMGDEKMKRDFLQVAIMIAIILWICSAEWWINFLPGVK